MIKNFEIVKYKCFENFKLEGLSRINIITGDNNVGKTALLEALFIQNNMMLGGLHGIHNMPLMYLAKNREVTSEDFREYFKNFLFESAIDAPNDINFIADNINGEENNNHVLESYTIINIYTQSYKNLTLEEKERTKEFGYGYKDFIIYKMNDFLLVRPLTPVDIEDYKYYDLLYSNVVKNYIDSSKPKNEKLIVLYSKVQEKNLQDQFLKYVKLFDSNILNIERYKEQLRLTLNNPNISLISSEHGEGTNRFMEIVATIITAEEKVVLIDEIENGIYYKKFKDIWKAIIEIAQQEDVQLFVTTHNEDTIEALKEASEEMEFEDISAIELYKKDGVIYPIVRDYESFSYNVEIGMEIR